MMSPSGVKLERRLVIDEYIQFRFQFSAGAEGADWSSCRCMTTLEQNVLNVDSAACLPFILSKAATPV